jgi:sugar lactone lactonase YvrE
MIKIVDVRPSAALPGGNISIHWAGKDLRPLSRPRVAFGDTPAHLISASCERIVAQVPFEASTGELTVSVDHERSNAFAIDLASLIAMNLHPVANPAIDAEGNVYTTLSGRRGEKVPNSVFKIDPQGNIQPFVADLVNPTGLAFNSHGEMFVSSRQDENIYKISAYGEKSTYCKGMGVATGIAFDRDDNLYVGDRSGNVFKIDKKREIFVFATLEPSVSAYHLAFDDEQNLYVTGPTTSSYDHIYRISTSGSVSTFFTGLGRPQGLAFDAEARLYVAASLAGRRGIIRITPRGDAAVVVSGNNLVGLAFGHHRALYLASTDSIFKLKSNWVGRPLP